MRSPPSSAAAGPKQPVPGISFSTADGAARFAKGGEPAWKEHGSDVPEVGVVSLWRHVEVHGQGAGVSVHQACSVGPRVRVLHRPRGRSRRASDQSSVRVSLHKKDRISPSVSRGHLLVSHRTSLCHPHHSFHQYPTASSSILRRKRSLPFLHYWGTGSAFECMHHHETSRCPGL